MKRAAVAVVVAFVSAACGPPLLTLPSGAGVPASADESAIAEAVSNCAGVVALTAEVAVSGSVQGHRVRLRLSAGAADPASVRLEAVLSFGPPLFIFVAKDGDAALLLPRDNRILPRGQPSAVLDAVTGVAVDAADLEEVLTGCSRVIVGAPARKLGDTWQVVSIANHEVYLHRESTTTPWGLVATIRRASSGDRRWRADFADRQDGVPRAIHLMSLDESGRIGVQFNLQLALSQVDVNAPLDDKVFTIQPPRDVQPMTLDELRRSGPFGLTATDGR
jgi:hypothetical protein